VDHFEECLRVSCNRTGCDDFRTSLLTYTTGSTFGDTGEDSYTAVMHWYGYSVLSVRNAMVTAIRDALWSLTPCQLLGQFYRDPIHPSLGGQLLFSDLLMQHLHGGFEFYSAAKAAGSLALHRRHTPTQPVNKGAWKIPLRRCFNVDTSLSLPVVAARTHGFEWLEENKDKPGAPYVKPGWVARTAGAVLTIAVNSILRPRAPEAKVTLTVTYLRSYDHMGSATFACVEGCACESMRINASSESHASVEAFASTNATQARDCVVTLTTVTAEKWKFLALGVETFIEPSVDLQGHAPALAGLA